MNMVIEFSEEENRKKQFKPALMDMTVFRPRKSKVFKSKKDYTRKPKHKNMIDY